LHDSDVEELHFGTGKIVCAADGIGNFKILGLYGH
jgi:hypothetical protein